MKRDKPSRTTPALVERWVAVDEPIADGVAQHDGERGTQQPKAVRRVADHFLLFLLPGRGYPIVSPRKDIRANNERVP